MMRRHFDAVLSFVISVLMVVSMVPTPALSAVAEGTSVGDVLALGGDALAEPVKDEATRPAVLGDGAGNVSFDMDASLVGATSEARPDVSPETVRVRFSGDYDGCDDAVMPEVDMVLDGAERSLPACAFVREGFEFSGWSTTVDGRDVVDDSETADVDESMRAISVPDSQALVDLRFLDADGYEVDLRQCVRGGMLSLYAQWRALPRVTLAFDANGGEGSMEAIDVVANGNVWVLPACSLSRDGFSFAGWLVDGTDVRLSDGAELADGDVASLASHAKDGRVTLHAVWEAKASRDTVPSGDKGDVSMTDDSASGDVKSGNVSVGADVDGSVEVTVDARGDSGIQADVVSEKAVEGGAGSDAAKGSDASGTVSSGADSGKSEGEAVSDAAPKASDGETVDDSSDRGESVGKAEDVSYVHRLIVRPKAGVGARAEDAVLGRSGDVLLLGFVTKADMDAARTWYEPRCDLVAEDIALGASEGEGGVAQVSMDGNDNPFKALGEAEEVPALSRLGVTVALLDTGMPSGVMSGVSMVSDDGVDRNGHASMMLEAMRGQNEHVRVMGVKVLDDAGHGTASSVYAGVMYAVDNGADVINMSFAGPDTEGNAAIAEAVRYALDHGVVVVAAAGNGGYDAGLVTPANVDGVFTVGAADNNGEVLASSNRGACVDAFVEASSTSVAAARVSGMASLGLDDWRERVGKMGVGVDTPVAGSVIVSDDEGVSAAADSTVYWGVSGSTLYLSASSGTNHTSSKALSQITSDSSVPWYSQRANITTVVIDGAFAPTSTAFWFYGCSNLVRFTNWSNLNVSNVTNMRYMFAKCSGASFNPNVSSWNTSKVTDMMGMFMDCSGAAFNPDVSNWDTSKVTYMTTMFDGCRGAAFNPDVSSWNMSSVTYISQMFARCYGAAFNPDVSSWNMPKVTSMNQMFYYCPGVAFNPDVSNWNTSKVMDMGGMFYGCSGAAFNPDVSSWDTSNVTDMGSMFSGCSGAAFNPDVSSWNTSSVTSMSRMFFGCNGAAFQPDVSNWNTSNVTDMSKMFYYCRGAAFNPDVSLWNTSKVTDMSEMFYYCSGAAFTSLDVSAWDFSEVTSTSNYLGLQNCSKLRELKVSATSKITGVSEHVAQGEYLNTWGNTNRNITGSTAADMVTTINAGNGAGTWEWEERSTYKYVILDANGTLTFFKAVDDIAAGTGVTVTDVNGTTRTGQLYEVDLDAVYTSGSQVPWYGQRSSIKSVRFAQVMKPASTAYWFYYCTILADFDSTNLDVSNVTDMSSMFNNCNGAAFNPDVSDWDTSSVTNMSNMFIYCSGAAFNPDVSNWNTSSVTNMSYMFYNCSGAAFNPDVSDWDTSSVTNMGNMFSECRGAAFNPDVSSWDTSNVTDMSYMFNNCSGAAFTSLDVSKWDFTKVPNMFTVYHLSLGNCNNLKELKVSATSKIKDVPEHTAQGLYLSTWGNTARGITGSTAANMVTTINAGNGAGTWEWEERPTYKYAILDADGTLTFFKSEDDIEAGTDKTVTDVDGTTRTGQLYKVDLAGYSSYSRVPWYAQRSSIQAVRFAQVMKPLSTAYWFYGCSKLTDFDSMNLDVSNVTSMSYMFHNCSDAAFNPDVSDWDTSSVMNMSWMFYGCSGAAFQPNVSAWNTSSVTNMDNMFYNCRGAAFNPDVSSWNTSSVTSMNRMFNNCNGAAFNPDVSHWNTSNVMNMSSMFYNCYGTSFNPDVSSWNTSSVTSMNHMFYYCRGAAFNPDVSNWDTSKVTDMSSMFDSCSGAALNPDVSSWVTSKVTNMSYMFSGCSGAAFNPDVSNWDMSKVTNMSRMFYSCSGNAFNPDVSNWDTSQVTDMNNMFWFCNGVAFNPDVSAWDTSKVTNMGSMFSYCRGAAFTSLDVSGWDFSKITSTSNYLGLNGCTNLRQLKVSATSKITGVPEHTAQGLYESTWRNKSLDITGSTAADMVTTINAGNGVGTWEWEPVTYSYAILEANGTLTFFKSEDDIEAGTGKTVTDVNGTTRTGQLYKVDLAGYSDYSSVPWYGQRSSINSVRFAQAMRPSSTAYWFYNCTKLADFDSTNLDVSNVMNMSYMFYFCRGDAFNPDVSNWNTSSVMNMSSMFYYCDGAAFNPDVSNWNTSSVTNMSNMFYYCDGAAFNPGVSSWDTSSVTNMSYMFYWCCGALFNPNVSNWDTSSVTNMSYMFYNCSGAAFNPDVSDWNTSSVTNMSNMFDNCDGAAFNPDVSNWNTSSVTNMSSMFNYCYGAAFNPDVSDWNTSSVTNMSCMFYNCSGAAFNPDVSNWNTSRVTNMSWMFFSCNGVAFTSLDVSNWDFTRVMSTSDYLGLQNCTNLRQLKVPANAKIKGVPEHTVQGDYAATWGNADRSVTGSTAANMVTTINAGNGAGTWKWDLAGYTVKLRAPVVLGADDVTETVTATDDWSVPSSPFMYARHDFVEWSGSDGETYAPGDVIEANTFSSGDTLILTAVYEPHEYSGVNSQDNPDMNGDGYGDNLAISMAASVSCVVKADGSTIWPSNVSVNNLSDVAVQLSSAKVDVCDGFHLVSDIGSAVEANSVSMRFGAVSATLDALSYSTKAALPQSASWQAAVGGSVPIAFFADVSDVSADLGQRVPFARVMLWAKVVD